MKILITGGASGLGGAMTRRFAQSPDNTVHFTYRSSPDKATELQEAFKNTRAIACDLSDQSSVDLLIQQLPEIAPDLIIHNAYDGPFIGTYFHKTAASDFQNSFQTNILPVISITQAAIALFRTRKSGMVLTVLSQVLENVPPMGTSVYAATKAYLAQLTKHWSSENKKFNIRAGAVAPGLMLSAMTEHLDERLLEQIRENDPEKRLLTAEETAEFIFQLAQDPERFDGAVLPITTRTIHL